VYEQSLEMNYLRVLPYPEEAELAPSSTPELGKNGRNNGSGGGRWMYNRRRPAGQDGNSVCKTDPGREREIPDGHWQPRLPGITICKGERNHEPRS
jgi:hypothetical protein